MVAKPPQVHTMPEIKLIALDLDGTLLNSRKELTPENAVALESVAKAGVEIVPATGRFFEGIPEVIRQLPFIHYAITINGAQVFDIREETVIYQAEIPYEQAVSVMKYLDLLPVIYDCYMGNWGWITRKTQEQAEQFVPDTHYLKMLRELRTPVDELKAYVLHNQQNVQKIQLFAQDMALKERLLKELGMQFQNIVVSSSVVNNIEINHKDANKGEALIQLANYLEIDRMETVAFGDGLNDLSMIKAAGIGIAMENAHPDVKTCADFTTTSCDENGVAVGIKRFVIDNK
jgi:Cof subfamily protein (haloacid dehalogenase superfamily)